MKSVSSRREAWSLCLDPASDPLDRLVALKHLADGIPAIEELPNIAVVLLQQDWQTVALVCQILETMIVEGACPLSDIFGAIPKSKLARVGQHIAFSGRVPIQALMEGAGSHQPLPVRIGCLAGVSAHPEGHPALSTNLLPILHEYHEPHLPALAAIALARIRDRSEETRRILLENLSRPEPEIRHMTTLALLELNPPEWEELGAFQTALHDAPEELLGALATIMDEYGLPLDDILPVREYPDPH